jgi:hypothetical protein
MIDVVFCKKQPISVAGAVHTETKRTASSTSISATLNGPLKITNNTSLLPTQLTVDARR